MEKIIKCAKRQDCYYKLSRGTSNETSINLSNEVFKFILPGGAPADEPIDIAFTVYKDDYIKALCYIVGKLPLYKTGSGGSTLVTYDSTLFNSYCVMINNFFGHNETALYNVKLLNRGDGRIYLRDLNDNGFNFRRFLVEDNSMLIFARENNILSLRLEMKNVICEDFPSEEISEGNNTVISESEQKKYILETVKLLSRIDRLANLHEYIENTDFNLGDSIKVVSGTKLEEEKSFTLTGMFIHTTPEDLKRRNLDKEGNFKRRWFDDQFSLMGRVVYLSGEWYANEYKPNGVRYPLILSDFNNMLEACYPNRFVYSFENNRYTLRLRNTPCQTIYFGSPGTGKSFALKRILREYNIIEEPDSQRKNCKYLFRTTFHPDTDYASFVGCYKPICDDDDESTITYSFVPQVFTEAYAAAWEGLGVGNQIFLVIEEINRGNCAQIFGDLFQLLDRNEFGYSEYKVKADADLAKCLIKRLGEGHAGIKDGNLCLPPNLNIMATMNTSDQSLFPMDSAFKRRWEWKFIPTTSPKDKERTLNLSFENKTLTEYNTTVNAGDYEYSWSEFLSKINSKIQYATHSEDKQLGFWFVKTGKHSNEISISTFVSKVVFYLWNDVFKDMGAKETNPFTIQFEGENRLMSYNSFFEINGEGQVVENIGVLHTFMRNVGMDPKFKEK